MTMRLIIASDSHGAVWRMIAAVHNQPEAKAMFFLGDGEYDVCCLSEKCPQLKIHAVAGNCDSRYSNLPETDIITAAGIKILCTHGHKYFVKSTTENLLTAAKKSGAKIALFGHTHKPYHNYVDGVHLFNPGSIYERSYGVIDITDAGIFCFHCEV